MKKLIILVGILQVAGCAQFSTTQTIGAPSMKTTAMLPYIVTPPQDEVPRPTSVPPNPYLLPYASFKFFMLQRDMKWEIGNTGVIITVPAGFVTDLASVPSALWSFGLSPADKYTRAAIVHDYLYWTQSCSKKQSDSLLSIAMKESDVGWFKQTPVYFGVVEGGQGSWDKNSREFRDGWPKIAPKKWREIPDGVDWLAHRTAMHTVGVRDKQIAKDLPYCKYGNSTDVPFDPSRPTSQNWKYDMAGNLVKEIVGQR